MRQEWSLMKQQWSLYLLFAGIEQAYNSFYLQVWNSNGAYIRRYGTGMEPIILFAGMEQEWNL